MIDSRIDERSRPRRRAADQGEHDVTSSTHSDAETSATSRWTSGGRHSGPPQREALAQVPRREADEAEDQDERDDGAEGGAGQALRPAKARAQHQPEDGVGDRQVAAGEDRMHGGGRARPAISS